MKWKLTTIIFLAGIILTFLSALLFPMGERVSSGAHLPGFPIGFRESYGGQMPGEFSTRFLPGYFALDLIIWILVSFFIFIFIQKRIKK